MISLPELNDQVKFRTSFHSTILLEVSECCVSSFVSIDCAVTIKKPSTINFSATSNSTHTYTHTFTHTRAHILRISFKWVLYIVLKKYSNVKPSNNKSASRECPSYSFWNQSGDGDNPTSINCRNFVTFHFFFVFFFVYFTFFPVSLGQVESQVYDNTVAIFDCRR